MAVSKLNSALWEKYEEFARARGRLVVHVLSDHLSLSTAHVLDFGCGTGGISIELAKTGARVDAHDINDSKIKVLRQTARMEQLNINILKKMSDTANSYDAIILLDVLEHVLHPNTVLTSLINRLKPHGLIYISTPNKLSVLNMLVDPHFSLPVVSLMKRKNVKRVLADWLRWQPKDRADFPELMSLKELDHMMTGSDLDWQFVNSQVVKYAVEYPESVWNRRSHLQLVRGLNWMQLTSPIVKLISDDIDVLNIWLNPTWYVVARKKPDFGR